MRLAAYLSRICLMCFLCSGVAAGQTFVFLAPDVVQRYSGSSHEFDVIIEVAQTDTPLVATAGGSWGLAHSGDEVEIVDVQPEGIVAEAEGGFGPCFFGFNMHDDGWTLGAIWDAGGHGCGTSIMFDGPEPALRATYVATGLTGQDVNVSLTWTNTLGSPAVMNNVVSNQGQSFPPELSDGSITLTPQFFQRADCNADGTVNLVDDIVLLMYLFINGPEPPCLAACDFNGDGALTLADAIFVELYLFLGGAPPPPPLGDCGVNDGAVSCLEYAPCP